MKVFPFSLVYNSGKKYVHPFEEELWPTVGVHGMLYKEDGE